MRSIITGVLFLIGGLSGGLVLRGTGSSGALALVGVVMIVIGVIQMARGSSSNGDSSNVSFHDPERDQEQMEEYQRAKAENARKAGQVALPDEVKALIAKTPGAEAEMKEVLQRTKGHLDAAQTNEMLLETAKRLNADYRRKQQAAGA